MAAPARATRHRLVAVLVALGAVAVAVVVWTVAQRPEFCEVLRPLPPDSRAEPAHESALTKPRAEAPPRIALMEPHDVPRAAIEAPQPVVAVASERTTPRLHGTVSLPPGRTESVADVAITATNVLGVEQSARTSDAGRYSFRTLEPGRYWLRVHVPEAGSADAIVDVRGDTRHDFLVKPRPPLLVRVVDEDGKPSAVVGLFAVATSEPPGEWCDEVRGSWTNPVGLGRFEPPRRQPSDAPTDVIGGLHLDRDPPLFVSLVKFQRVLATQRVEPGALFVDFVLRSDDPNTQMGSLRLRVVDCETKAPIESATVMEYSGAMRMVRGLAGVFELPSLLPGTHTLHIRAQGRGTSVRSVRILPGEALDLGDVCLDKGRWIAGRIADETGAGGVFEIRMDPCEPDGRARPGPDAILVQRSEPDGTFRIGALEPGFHRLEVLRGEKREQAECVGVFDTRDAPVENAVLTVSLGVDLVVDPDGRHGSDARLAVIDEKGVRLLSRRVREPAPMRVRLAPGRYTVEFTSAREDPAPRTVPVELIRDPVVVTMR